MFLCVTLYNLCFHSVLFDIVLFRCSDLPNNHRRKLASNYNLKRWHLCFSCTPSFIVPDTAVRHDEPDGLSTKRLYDYIYSLTHDSPVSGLEDYSLSFQSLTCLKRRYYIRPTLRAWSCAANPCHGVPAGVRAATRASLPEQHSPETTPSAHQISDLRHRFCTCVITIFKQRHLRTPVSSPGDTWATGTQISCLFF